MICPNCKKSIPNNTKFCTSCGEKLTNDEHAKQYNYSKNYSNVEKDHQETHDTYYEYSKNYSKTDDNYNTAHNDLYNYSEMYSNINQQKVTSEDDYINSYIKNNYNIINRLGFSIPALILGPIYLLYRKRWLYGFTILLGMILLYLYNVNIALLFTIVINLYLGFKFNEMYLNFVNRKVEQIKISNPDKTSTELLELCKKNGGTMNKDILIAIVITLISIITLLFVNNHNETKEEEEYINNTINELHFKIPDGFEKSKYNSDNYYSSSYIDEKNYCHIAIYTTKNYNNETIDKYISTYITNEKSPDEISISDKKINNLDWKIITTTDEYMDNSSYVIEVNNIFYHVQYNGNKDSSCIKLKDKFINSLNF